MTYVETLLYYAPEFLRAFKETGLMLLIATLSGAVIGLMIGLILFLTRNEGSYPHKVLYQLCNVYVNIMRSFPFLLLVVTVIPVTRLIYGTAFGALAASFPLSLIAVAVYARLTEQVLLDLPSNVLDLANSLGMTWVQLVRQILLVEARSGLILGLTSMVISLVSYSTVMGVVGGGGIGDFAIRYGYQRYEYSVMYTAVFIMILLVGAIQCFGTWLAKKIDKRK